MEYAQKPMGMRTRLKPEAAIFSKSAKVTQVSQWGFRTESAAAGPRVAPRVNSSTMEGLERESKTEGVIQLRRVGKEVWRV